MKKFCVIGLGRFGYQVAVRLAENGMDVLAVDSNESIISSIKDKVSQAIAIRVHDEASLRNIGVDEMDLVIVSMGENLAQSILMTALLKKRLHIPQVVARAINSIHKEILILVGADEVILPEKEVGLRLADNLSYKSIDLLRLTKDMSVATIHAPPRFVGKKIEELNLVKEYRIQCIGLRDSKNQITLIDKNYIIKKNDVLVCAGNKADIEKFA